MQCSKMQLMQAWLSRMDGHMGLANSMALKIAAITNNTGDPEGGGVVRTTDGGNFDRFMFWKVDFSCF